MEDASQGTLSWWWTCPGPDTCFSQASGWVTKKDKKGEIEIVQEDKKKEKKKTREKRKQQPTFAPNLHSSGSTNPMSHNLTKPVRFEFVYIITPAHASQKPEGEVGGSKKIGGNGQSLQ